ncbi:hypothetical protein JCGZ_24189 [Jatropha curcas]|uniref:Leucine-rich repeat-containing N-terminal plant-type domain-containing protein n=1 Tax=Jatropha curcas TaxID=180498 RepID=A0A067JMG4_JATCU|nr:hypothetical protein JCGZ_24189 [Jatropha curcas]
MELKWLLICLIRWFQVIGNTGCFEEERLALIQFKASLESDEYGSKFPILPSWIDEPEHNCCEWERVSGNSTAAHVIHLSLDNLRGYYYDENIYDLKVSIFQHFKELRSLNLSYNNFGGFVEKEGLERLSNLKKLKVLDLSYNRFNRSILSWVTPMTSIKILNLSVNDMEGSSPYQEVTKLQNLEVLDLSSNNFNGTLPTQELASLQNLKKLDLSFNRFNLIQDFIAFKSLEILDLSWNFMNGTLPPYMWAPPSLKVLSLRGNRFNGSLSNFIAFKSLEILDLSWNHINGTLPPYKWAPPSLKVLSLCGNRFNGSLSNFIAFKSLEILDLSWNHINGTLPPYKWAPPSLKVLSLCGNRFNGSLSNCHFPLPFSDQISGHQTDETRWRSTSWTLAISVPASLSPIGA